MKFNLGGEIVAKNSGYTVTEKFIVVKKLSNTLFTFMNKVLIVTEILHQPAELLIVPFESEVFVAEIDYATLHYLARKNYITKSQMYELCERYGFDNSSVWKMHLLKDEVCEIEAYNHLIDGKIHPDMVVITDKTDTYKQFCLRVGCGHYVYFQNNYASRGIVDEEIFFSDLTDEFRAEARENFELDNGSYSEEEKQMLSIELFFETNIY